MDNEILAKIIYDKAIACGFDNCGIVALSDLDEFKQRLEERKEKIPQSARFYHGIEPFTKLRELYPWAKAVIVCTSYYGKYKYPETLQGKYAKSFMLSCDTNYLCEEYQGKNQFEKWLAEMGIHFEGGNKYAPRKNLPLRQAAVSAGLGIIRRNNFFYTEKGSYYNLEGYIIDKALEYKQECKLKGCSQKCNLCRRACPTKSLSAAYTMNPTSCISFLTTFGQGSIPPHITENNLDNWICGCDACQDACPYNHHDWSEGVDFPMLNEIVTLLQPENIVKASDEELAEKVIPKTEKHLTTEQVDVLRISAKRVLDRII